MSRFSYPPRWPLRAVVLGVVVLLALAALLIVESRRLSSLYWHDVRQDHEYRFSNALVVPVSVTQTGFDVPFLNDRASTVLLRMEVSTTWLGRWLEPAIEVTRASGSTSVQFLERGADGKRYLNLGDVVGDPLENGEHVGLRGRHLAWSAQSAELLQFHPPAIDAGPLLVIAPHPDDAEIAAFGLYSETDAWIVTVSAGNYPNRRLEHLLDDLRSRSRWVGELRSWDSVAIPQWGGVPAERAINLGYFTGSLAHMYAQPDRLVMDELLNTADILQFRQTDHSELLEHRVATSTWGSLVKDLVAVLEQVRPATIVTPHPMLDAASDHRLTTVALAEALKRVGTARRSLLLYTNHHVTSEYFPFGPSYGLVSVPPWTEYELDVPSVYSHRLDDEARLRKLFALEAQHDLRSAPHFGTPGIGTRLFSQLGRTVVGLWRDPADSYSYLRRGPRPNELFLVLSEDDVPSLRLQISGFLAELRRGEVPETPGEDYR